MRVPVSWLRALVPGLTASVDEIAAALVQAGLEVEQVLRYGDDVRGVVVGRVLDIEELTEFKKPIRYCHVDIGSRVHEVVCGATNFAVGDVIAGQWLYDWARPHIKNHPALFVDGQGRLSTCRACGNPTEPIAKRYVADVFTYTMQRCTTCGWHGRLSIEPERMSIVRGV